MTFKRNPTFNFKAFLLFVGFLITIVVISTVLGEPASQDIVMLLSTLLPFLPLILIFVIFYIIYYLFVIMPRSKHKQMLKNLKKGDNVTTNEGIFGTIVDIDGDIITLKVGEKDDIKINQNHIATLMNQSTFEKQRIKGVAINTQANYEINEATQFGGFWIRVGAYFIDVVVLLIPVLLISFLFRAVTPATDEVEQAVVGVMDFILKVIVWWIYFAVLHSSSWQASVGKKAVGLKVVGENGNRIPFDRATGRYFAGFLSALILGIGYMMVAWTKKKQGLHDMIAGTFVIKIKDA